MPQVKFVLTKKSQHGLPGQVVEINMPKGYELTPRQASLMTEYKEPEVKKLVVNVPEKPEEKPAQ